MTRSLIALLAIAFLATACTNPTPRDQGSEEATATEPAALAVADQSSPDAPTTQEPEIGARPDAGNTFLEQPRMKELQEQTDPEMGTPGTTAWRASQEGVPDSVTGDSNPAQLLFSFLQEARLVDALGVDVSEQTLRIRQEGEKTAEALILQWGIKDDSVAGRDLLLRISTEDHDTWHIDEVRERFHCYRGVHDGLCL